MNKEQAYLELLKAALSAALLLMTWIIGQRILALWERRKKQQEIDLASLSQLHRIHAEFRTVGRLWRSFAIGKPDDDPVNIPPDIHWQLQVRAAAAEGEMEALVVKLATERTLGASEVDSLAFLREAYQLLRRSIRDRKWFYWQSGTVPYVRSYHSVVNVAAVISRPTRRPTPEEAARVLERIRQASATLNADPDFQARAHAATIRTAALPNAT